MTPKGRGWMIGRLLTIGALAILAGNAMAGGPKAIEAVGLVIAIAGVATTGFVLLKERRGSSD